MDPAMPTTQGLVKNILLVEDDAVFREGLAAILEDQGYHTMQACDGKEALDAHQWDTEPDLVLLDMMTPVNDGWTFLRKRRQIPALASIPVLILTALRIATQEWATDLGACGVLQKPIDIDVLLAEMKGCLPD
jgi:CheY-like chemotaxis protein